MTTDTTLALTFTPRPMTPDGAGDFAQLQALFKAAAEVRRVPGNLQTIGDPVVVIPREIWHRVTTTMVDADRPQTVLEYMIANYPGTTARVAESGEDLQLELQRRAGLPCCPNCGTELRADLTQGEIVVATECKVCGWIEPSLGEIRRSNDQIMGALMGFQPGAAEADNLEQARRVAEMEAWRDGAAALAREGLLEVGAAQGPGEFFKSLRAEIGQVRGDLRVEERKVADLSAELARRLAQVAEARVAEFDPTSIEAYEQGIRERVLAIPGVLRVHWPQWGMLRAIVAISPDVPNQRESLEIQIEGVIDDPEIEHCVQEEPGMPAPGYKVRGGHADSAAAPTLRWYWRHASDGIEHEQGPLASEAAAVDATWEESARDGEPEMEP